MLLKKFTEADALQFVIDINLFSCAVNFSDADLPSPPVLDAVLEPGDLLYFPRGYIHQVSAAGLGFVSLGPFHCARFIFVLCITVCCMHDCLCL